MLANPATGNPVRHLDREFERYGALVHRRAAVYPGRNSPPLGIAAHGGVRYLFRALAIGLTTLAFAVQVAAAEPAGGVKVGQTVADFRLPDAQGQLRSLSELAGAGPVALVFVGVECPLVRLYIPRLLELNRQFAGQGLHWVAIDSNAQDDAEEIAEFARESGWELPLLCDAGGQVAGQLGARRTPEVVLLDADRVVRYRGRIDNQYAPGQQRAAASERDLATAIEAMLSGNPVARTTTEAVGCLIGRKHVASARAQASYSTDVADILQRNCVVCHRAGDIGPFALDNYRDAAAWAEAAVETVGAGRMPPWPAAGQPGVFHAERRLTTAEKQTLADWLAAGCPEGPQIAAAEPASLTAEDAPFQPDLVYPMSDAPFDVQATGTVDYQYFAIDPQWTSDRWIRRVVVLPGDPSVVHHVLLFAQRPGVRYPSIYPGELIGAFVPGFRDSGLPPGTAYRLPAGTKILFQMHYTPNGLPRRDLTHVAFEFADESTVVRNATSGRAINVMFQIPPGAGHHEVRASHVFRREVELLKLIPHLHVRGQSFRYEAVYPGGNRELLLEIPRWDFNWQLEYAFREPKHFPAGTELVATATFDNSPENPLNPDPSQWVTFGEQTWDEMLIGFFIASEPREPSQVASVVPLASAAEGVLRPGRPREPGQVAKGLLGLYHAARGLTPGKPEPYAEEMDHVILGALSELAQFRQQAQDRDAPAEAIRDAAGRLRRGAETLQKLISEPGVRAVRVEPVDWPLVVRRAARS